MKLAAIFVVFAGLLFSAWWAAFAFWMCAYHAEAKILGHWQHQFYYRSSLSAALLAIGAALVIRRRKRATK